MGKAIAAAADSSRDFTILAAIRCGDDLTPGLRESEVAIDFTQADATAKTLRGCVETAKPLVLGTTGHSHDQLKAIEEAAAKVPIVFAPNFSVGVNALFWLAREATRLLGADFDLEIVEMHHRLKKDAPSGTAKKLAEILSKERQLTSDDHLRHGREGNVGERSAEEIGIHALRGGDVVGEHTVVFAGQGECLELTHKASSRETFARGALRAARWVVDQAPGLYSMSDVIALPPAR